MITPHGVLDIAMIDSDIQQGLQARSADAPQDGETWEDLEARLRLYIAALIPIVEAQAKWRRKHLTYAYASREGAVSNARQLLRLQDDEPYEHALPLVRRLAGSTKFLLGLSGLGR
ncbi:MULTISPECIES: DUF6415 family natural product biosynthesis protein [Streptomyces]|uniref:DUF6415 family natural product biosynthesis protein n=1 Tax=Streptomyces TaxID=1883 RepID=UPI00345C0B47